MEKMIAHQQRDFPTLGEFQYGATDERPESEVPNVFEKFEHDCELRAVGVSPEGLAKETAGFERRARAIYAKTLFAGTKTAPADDAHRLEKRFMGKRERDARTVRLEKSENGAWVMEYDKDGELIAGHAWGFWPGEK